MLDWTLSRVPRKERNHEIELAASNVALIHRDELTIDVFLRSAHAYSLFEFIAQYAQSIAVDWGLADD